MSKIIGIRPEPGTTKLIENFENEVLIRHNNQQLVSTVYVDVQEKRWAVAVAYNFSRNPGISGHENPLEVRYLANPQEPGSIRLFRSNEPAERVIGIRFFSDPDAFIRFALSEERNLATGLS